ncbi:MAG: bifunctional hydroxymethylpyrimidine kinase/phosphomethylpyrimidine kinase, partial [Methanomicrobium sp.]|nr:bifunctional hydroxymethylpyrimidine kinase/phosphomethylpyrimidine kinase [Methanomicrobium sp.]
ELSGIDLSHNPSESAIADAASKILSSGAEYVLIKGGHLSGEYSSDYLISKSAAAKDADYVSGKIEISDDRRCRIETKYDVNRLDIVKFTGLRFNGDIHGSGCCLSSAIAAGLAKGYAPQKACAVAKEFIAGAIKNAYISESKRYSINPQYLK